MTPRRDRVPAVTALLESAAAVALHDRAAYLVAAARVTDSSWAWQQAIIGGELDQALELTTSAPDDIAVEDHLTLYVLLQRAGRVDAAAGALGRAIDQLATGSADQQQWAAWFQGELAPEPRLAAHVCEDPDTHGVFLHALAQKFPVRASEYLARAARMKYKDTFYTLALEDGSIVTL